MGISFRGSTCPALLLMLGWSLTGTSPSWSQERGPIPESPLSQAELSEMRENFITNGWTPSEVEDYFERLGTPQGYAERDLRRFFPEIGSDASLASVCSVSVASPSTATYAFATAGDGGQVRVDELSCRELPDGLYCELSSIDALSAEGVAKYFFIGESISRKTAVSITRYYYDEIAPTMSEFVRELLIHRLDRTGSTYAIELRARGCECHANLEVSIFRVFGVNLSFEVVDATDVICR
jgi:hypothetical protein